MDEDRYASYCLLIIIAGFMGYAFIIEPARESLYKLDNVKPIKYVTPYEDSLVYAANDSVLNARKARYDALAKDYEYAYNIITKNYASFRARKHFDKMCIYPEYTDQIGVKNMTQYKRYIERYANDSLAPAYRDVYKNKVLPFVRNNTRTR